MRLHHLITTCLLGLTAAANMARAEVICAEEICIETVQDGDVVTFYAINRFVALPATLRVDLTVENLGIIAGSNAPTVVEADGGAARLFLFRMAPIRPGRAWSWSYQFEWFGGDFTAQHDASAIYQLPYPLGTSYPVTQGCNGDFSHFGEQSFAVDFDLPIGTPIHAARAGTVVEVYEDFVGAGTTEAFRDRDNRVLIEHDDGSYAVYAHLRPQGAEVVEGQVVSAGTLLGYSGNTGYSSGPHLHFHVAERRLDGSQNSVPTPFLTASGLIPCPAVGDDLVAIPVLGPVPEPVAAPLRPAAVPWPKP